MYAFYDCLCEQVRQETHCSSFAKGFDTWAEATSPYDTNVDNISLNQWLNMWGRLCRGTAGMSGEQFTLPSQHCSALLSISVLAKSVTSQILFLTLLNIPSILSITIKSAFTDFVGMNRIFSLVTNEFWQNGVKSTS